MTIVLEIKLERPKELRTFDDNINVLDGLSLFMDGLCTPLTVDLQRSDAVTFTADFTCRGEHGEEPMRSQQAAQEWAVGNLREACDWPILDYRVKKFEPDDD